MPTIYIDDRPYPITGEDRNLLDVCLGLGFNIPYFCWHPAMHSVGACRQCAVKQFKDPKDKKGQIVMACMTQARDGTRISIDDPEAAAFRARCIEWLMLNHPHDCPVCDEGGECHLQDMTVMTGHVHRRSRFPKRTHRNQHLGPFVNHEMNRCIQCYRCVRFYREYAGGRDLDVFGCHDRVYFGRHADGVLENEFSGNLVEVCPTGVFTDKTLKGHYTRKWDLQTAPSICVHCGLGCNTIPGERYGTLRRIHSRYNGEVNRYFICDRGRFGYEFVNSDSRIRRAALRRDGQLREAAPEEALARVRELLTGGVIGIGSARASLETNFALQQLVGKDRFFLGVAEKELGLVRTMLRMLREGPARTPSLHGVDVSDSVLVLGEDVTNTAPMMALALRQAVLEKPIAEAGKRQGIQLWEDAVIREAIQQEKGPFFVATPQPTKLDDVATETYRAAPDDLARLGFAVAHAIDAEAPAVEDLPEELTALAVRIARNLQESLSPLVVSGIGCGSEAVVRAAANVAWALVRTGRNGQLAFTVPECNSAGTALMEGGSMEAAVAALTDGRADTVLIVENDVYRHLDIPQADALFDAARHVVVIDHLTNATTEKAEVVLPASTFAESDGTLVNNECRAQRFFKVMMPEEPVKDSWRWLSALSVDHEHPEGRWKSHREIVQALAETLPVFKAVPEIAPPPDFRLVGQKVPRQSHRYSGRTAMHAHLDVHEPRPPEDMDAPLSFSMEGYQGIPPASLVPRFWAPGWNSVQAVNKFQEEIAGPLRGGDPGRRLVEPARVEKPLYFHEIPKPFSPRPGQWLILPAWHIFGSDELSVLSPGIARRAPAPYLVLNTEDAERLGLHAGQQVELVLDAGDPDGGRPDSSGSPGEARHRVVVDVNPVLPKGAALMPVGLPGMPGISLPAWGKITVLRQTEDIGHSAAEEGP